MVETRLGTRTPYENLYTPSKLLVKIGVAGNQPCTPPTFNERIPMEIFTMIDLREAFDLGVVIGVAAGFGMVAIAFWLKGVSWL